MESKLGDCQVFGKGRCWFKRTKTLCSGETRVTEMGFFILLWHPVIACILVFGCVLIPEHVLEENGLHCPNLAMGTSPMEGCTKGVTRALPGALEPQKNREVPQCPHHSLPCFLPPTPACSGHLHHLLLPGTFLLSYFALQMEVLELGEDMLTMARITSVRGPEYVLHPKAWNGSQSSQLLMNICDGAPWGTQSRNSYFIISSKVQTWHRHGELRCLKSKVLPSCMGYREDLKKTPETPSSGNFSRVRQTFIYLDNCSSGPHPAPACWVYREAGLKAPGGLCQPCRGQHQTEDEEDLSYSTSTAWKGQRGTLSRKGSPFFLFAPFCSWLLAPTAFVKLPK